MGGQEALTPGKSPFLSTSRLCFVALEEQASGPASFFPPSFSQAVQECCTCLCLPQGGPLSSPCPASCLDEQVLRAGLQGTVFG